MIGYEYFVSNGIHWRRHHGSLIPLSMPHVEPALSEKEAAVLLAERNGRLIRWETDFDTPEQGHWWHVIKTERENMGCFSGNTRSKIRRGLKNFSCGPVSREDICAQGHAIYVSAYERYSTFEKRLTGNAFRQAVEALPPETEFWAARDNATGELAAFSENLVRDGATFYVTMWFPQPALQKYAGYALIHSMNKHYLNERGLKYVTDGARSISHDTAIQKFLIDKFQFRRAYARLHVAYSTWLAPGVHSLYPLRGLFSRANGRVARKLSVLFEQERLRRACLQE